MLEEFKQHIDDNLSFLKESKLLIAISGGLDSVALTYLCKHVGFNFSLAHCNFNLRGEESNADENFVYALAENMNVEVFIQNFDTKQYAEQNKLSTQVAARELRYNWFHELAEQLQFDYTLTAHHADDNLETFLINLSRGTGLDGLTGIPQVNKNIVRPLLPFSREDLETYVKDNKIDWRDDSSNESVKYLRNKLRHDVLPILKSINPQLLQNFNKTINHLKESQQIVNDRIDDISDDVINVTSKGIYLNIDKIQALNHSKAYLYELLNDYGFSEWNDIYNLLTAQSGKQVLSKHWRLIKDRNTLILSQRSPETFQYIQVNVNDQTVSLPSGVLQFETVSKIEKALPNCIYIDGDKLQFPLTIRTSKEGDYFFPLGMKGKKKVSKYYKDEKLSLIDKENTLLLCSSDDIVWIINRRADNRFKVEVATKSIIKICFNAIN